VIDFYHQIEPSDVIDEREEARDDVSDIYKVTLMLPIFMFLFYLLLAIFVLFSAVTYIYSVTVRVSGL